jgi:hypothetical protein
MESVILRWDKSGVSIIARPDGVRIEVRDYDVPIIEFLDKVHPAQTESDTLVSIKIQNHCISVVKPHSVKVEVRNYNLLDGEWECEADFYGVDDDGVNYEFMVYGSSIPD